MHKFKEVFPGVHTDNRSYEEAPPDKLVLSKCRIGLEMEVEGTGNFFKAQAQGYKPILSDFWVDHEDNSLKDQGREFVFREPLFGRDLVSAIEEFVTVAHKHKFKISARTGLHVHLDVRNLTMEQVGSLCFAYAILERPLFRFAGIGRAENHFCVPWFAAPSNLRHLYPLIKTDSPVHRVRNAVDMQTKYSALNLLPIAKYGSVEFRHLETTFDFEFIMQWINILMRLKEFANKHDGSPDVVPRVFSAGPLNFARKVLGRYAFILEYPEVEAELWSGMNAALAFTINQHGVFGEMAQAFKRGELLIPTKIPEPPLKDLVVGKYKTTALQGVDFAQVEAQVMGALGQGVGQVVQEAPVNPQAGWIPPPAQFFQWDGGQVAQAGPMPPLPDPFADIDEEGEGDDNF